MFVQCRTLLIAIFLCFANVHAKDCIGYKNCQQCIQDEKCKWCIQPKENSTNCDVVDKALDDWCNQDSVFLPDTMFSAKNTIQDDEFVSNSSNTIQLKPQRIHLTLRPKETKKIHFQYKQAKNYPIDLYFLMDMSISFKNYKEQLEGVAKNLTESIGDISNNVQLGFGSFIDKKVLPFVNTHPEKLKNPCVKASCVTPYSFKNNFKLTKEDYRNFGNAVKAVQVSGNVDNPEGGFDALMQAMVCKSEIGWRPKARHVIVFSTDGAYHIAGDGKLAGILEPNDAKCHMKDNTYVGDLKYDYPSLSQLNKISKINNVNIIFAVVAEVKDVYEKLIGEQVIENSVLGIVEKKADNIVELISDNYKKISQSVVMATEELYPDIKVEFSTTCDEKTNNGCKNVHVDDTLNFTASITALPSVCPSEGNVNKTIRIKPQAVEEFLTIELNIICDCPCSLSTHPTYKTKSGECNNHGNLKCGVCDCLKDWFGNKCQCTGTQTNSTVDELCRQNSLNQICSGVGECKCGQCICKTRDIPEEKYQGDYCQWNNFNCLKGLNDEMCSGILRGTCDKSECICKAGYAGDSCELTTAVKSCINQNDKNQLVCSGKGDCISGKCDCKKDDAEYFYQGRFCEKITSKISCKDVVDCVECLELNTGILKDTCDQKCTKFKTNRVKKFTEKDEDKSTCRIQDENECNIYFKYIYKDAVYNVTVLEEKQCPAVTSAVAWILGIVGSIFLAGLIMLIIWKVTTTVIDKREYNRFDRERQNLKWSQQQNPLFNQATQTYNNPAYNRSSIQQ